MTGGVAQSWSDECLCLAKNNNCRQNHPPQTLASETDTSNNILWINVVIDVGRWTVLLVTISELVDVLRLDPPLSPSFFSLRPLSLLHRPRSLALIFLCFLYFRCISRQSIASTSPSAPPPPTLALDHALSAPSPIAAIVRRPAPS